MRLAAVGIDERTIQLARAAARGGHSLAWFAADLPAPTLVDSLRSAAPGVQRIENWESLLTGEGIDAVLVAEAADWAAAIEQLRRLVQAGVSLMLTQPWGESSLDYYELEMAARETASGLAVFLPALAQPAVIQMARLAAALDSPLGPIEQCLVEHPLADRGRRSVLRAFAVDTVAIASVLGRIVRVGSLPVANDAGFAALAVQMADAAGRPIRWSVRQGQSDSPARLTLVGALGSAQMEMTAQGQWSAHAVEKPAAIPPEPGAFDSAAWALDELAAAAADRRPAPSWHATTAAMELVEALARSVRTGRLVEVRTEGRTEQGNFKGVMAAAGCSLLLGALFLLGLLAVLGEALGQQVGRVAFVAVLAVFAAFLAVQLLGRFASPAKVTGSDEDSRR